MKISDLYLMDLYALGCLKNNSIIVGKFLYVCLSSANCIHKLALTVYTSGHCKSRVNLRYSMKFLVRLKLLLKIFVFFGKILANKKNVTSKE